jgi:viroplasmin
LPYVITEPESIKGICETWDECRSKVEGVKGAKYQKVHDEAEAQALLKGTGVVLKPGLHVFTDGNHRGGVGVVIVWMSENPSDDPTVVAEIATSVRRIFYGGVVPALGSEEEVEVALKKSRHVLAELGGLYLALWQAPANSAVTIRADAVAAGGWTADAFLEHVDRPFRSAVTVRTSATSGSCARRRRACAVGASGAASSSANSSVSGSTAPALSPISRLDRR